MIGPTADELVTRVRRRLSEGDAEFFTDDVILTCLSDGQDVVATRCPWTCVGSLTVLSVTNQAAYVLPVEMIDPKATYYRGSDQRPDRCNYIEPDQMDRYNLNASLPGWSRNVTYRRTDTGIALELFPIPNETGAQIDVEGYMRPTPLTSLTDRTDLDPLVTHVLVNYALWQLKGKDEEVGQSDRYRQDFESSLGDLEETRMRAQLDQNNRVRYKREVTNRWWFWRW